ncbi:MAG: AhpC/TSA family protein [Flavobacteriales bacterium]|nr:AhpC/TSA family protein [Flavobacteriales bacterium]
MKKLTLITILATLLFSCGSENPQSGSKTSISGTLTNLTEGSLIYLDYLTPQQLYTKDSTTVDGNGFYSFNYKVEILGYYRLRINNQNFINLVLNVDESPIINGDGNNLMDTYTIEGSDESNKLKQFNLAYKANAMAQDSIGRIYQANPNDPNLFMQLQQAKFLAVGKMNNTFMNLINDNPSSLVSLAAVQQLDPKVSADLYKKVDEALSKTMASNPWFTDFHKKVESMVNLFIGDPAPDFTLNDTKGNPLSLSSLKGKVILIDFWASWCRPCRAENPNVVKAYDKYHSKGFDILSVSLDKDKNKWVAAIKQDNLKWPNHVSDLQAWGSSVVPLYGIGGIPFTLLIDKDGIILGKNLRGEELEKKLAEVFN